MFWFMDLKTSGNSVAFFLGGYVYSYACVGIKSKTFFSGRLSTAYPAFIRRNRHASVL